MGGGGGQDKAASYCLGRITSVVEAVSAGTDTSYGPRPPAPLPRALGARCVRGEFAAAVCMVAATRGGRFSRKKWWGRVGKDD